MPIDGTRSRDGVSPAMRIAAVFLLCIAAGYWAGPRAVQPTATVDPAIVSAAGHGSALGRPLGKSVRESVQEMLAQGGCPGWIAMANEPDLLAGPSHVDARFTLTAGGAGGEPVELPPVDDGLVSEAEDLLTTSPEVTDAAAGGAAATSVVQGTPTTSSSPAGADDLIEQEHDLVDPSRTGPPDARSDAQSPDILPAPHTAMPSDELLNDRNDLLTPPPAAPRTPPPAPQGFQAPPAEPVAPSPFSPPDMQAPHSTPAQPGNAAGKPKDDVSHCEFVARSLYPSAGECRKCHEKIYDEWSASSHAYAAVSPMFHKFEQKINDLTQGTIGYFCYRCHLPVGTSLGMSRAAPLWDAPQVAREGVTCVACHRINEMYGKTNGERRIVPGDQFAPVYGSIGGGGVAEVVAEKDKFKVKTSPDQKGPGQDIHAAAFSFPQLSKSEFCMSCHQVAVYPGIKLEVVWEQYRASPACKKGVSCQDCHMGRIPGVASGYEYGPAALINGKSVNSHRKHANHVFYGPGYSIAHPGIFPFNPKADRWTMRDWLLFDWRAGWGTDAFEDALDNGQFSAAFPPVWEEADDRRDAREIIDANLKKRARKDQLRAQVMENGSHVDGPYFDSPRQVGQELRFHYDVVNTNDGHNLPTASLGAQPQLWANIVLIGPRGQRLWETGYLDSNADLADIHSEDVRHKRIEFDWQLFNLQTMFLITGAKGTDREFFLPVNIDIDPLPFIRPAPQPVSVLNHPPFIRMEARSLAPLGSRRVPYKVPGHLLREPGRYRLSFRMRSRVEPPYFMRFCDATVEMQRSMVEGTLDFHQSSVEFEVR